MSRGEAIVKRMAVVYRLANSGPVTAAQLAAEAGCSLQTAQRTLRALGRIEEFMPCRDHGGRRGSHPIEWCWRS